MPRKNAARFVLSEHASSPINISGSIHHNAPTPKLAYPTILGVELSIANKVLTAFPSAPEDANGSLTIAGKSYALKQLHVHTPSEHTIDGARAAFEWHFVHQTAEGEYAVIGVFMDEGAETTASYAPLIETLSSGKNSTEITPRSLIPASKVGWHYQGTLTTPPYDPVYWIVVEQRLSISTDDRALLETALL